MTESPKEYVPPPGPTWRFYALFATVAGITGFVVGLSRLSVSMSLISALVAAVSGAFAAFARDCFVSIIIRCSILGVFLYFLPLEAGTALTLYPLLLGLIIGSLGASS